MDDTRSVTSTTSSAGIAIIRMNARHGNALNDDLVEGLSRAVDGATGDPGVRGLLLASGGKLFSPGLDLVELSGYDRPEMERFMGRFGDLMLSLFSSGKPVFAAVSGHAVAGGCVLALTADRRILKRGALMGLNEIQVGVPLPFGVAHLLRESVSAARLEEIALLGRNYSDDEAVEAGLAHEVHETEGFEGYCLERLGEYAAKDPRAFALTKSYLRSAAIDRIRAHDRDHRGEFLDCWFSDSTRKRITEIVASLRK